MEQQDIERLMAEAVSAVVDTTSNPKSLLVESDVWDSLMSKFQNGQKVKVIVYGYS